MKTKIIYLLVLAMAVCRLSYAQQPKVQSQQFRSIGKEALKDKIKGAWAGQTIGVTYGGPTEFRFKGVIIPDYLPIVWNDTILATTFTKNPGLYDDLYMDFTFMEVLEKNGLQAPAEAHANKFANAGYILWHANQRARNNILNGMKPPSSGNWRNNPYADDIDFQIEADFIGIMCPGIPETANTYADRIGHIMNSGDGYYGGVFVANAYAEAFVNNNLEQVVKAGLKAIPAESEFHQCVSDAITWHKKYPDWRDTWFQLEKKYANERGCPKGVFDFFNIDAKLNAAYVVIGLLYGNGDFTKTIDIATRCGQDSDCNPSTAAGILGAMQGYSKIPEYWKKGLAAIEDKDFPYTTISLNKAYNISYRHAIANLMSAGTDTAGQTLKIKVQEPSLLRFEQNFKGFYPRTKLRVGKKDIQEYNLEFNGTGFVILGGAFKKGAEWLDDPNNPLDSWVSKVDVIVDDVVLNQVSLPISRLRLRQDLFAFYGLKPGTHKLQVKVTNPKEGVVVNIDDFLIYGLPEGIK